MEEVRTERLIGTRPLLRDADELHPICADPRVADWIWPGDLGGPRKLAQVRALLVKDADHWKRHRFGAWVVRDRGTRAVVGRAGLSWELEQDEVACDWLIDADRWGEGLATEIALEAVRCAFDVLGLESIIAETLPHNVGSRAVMEKCGFAFERDVERVGLPHVRYRLRRPA
jgi:RimJ/RimL family protein N-acetyltransferase